VLARASVRASASQGVGEGAGEDRTLERGSEWVMASARELRGPECGASRIRRRFSRASGGQVHRRYI